MTITLNGKAIALFVGGMIAGAAIALTLVVGPVGKVQAERDEAKLAVANTNAQLAGMQQTIIADNGMITELKQQLAVYQKGSGGPGVATAPQSGVGLLSSLHPGLGAAVQLIDEAAKQSAAKKAAEKARADLAACGPKAHLETNPNWQGSRCVADSLE